MKGAVLLERLEKVCATGPGRWIACCPAHADHSPSLSICELGDGRILLHCFAGCQTHGVLAAIGLEFSNLFPEPLPGAKGKGHRPEYHPFPAADILACLEHDLIVALLILSDVVYGIPPTQESANRIAVIAGRISAAINLGG